MQSLPEVRSLPCAAAMLGLGLRSLLCTAGKDPAYPSTPPPHTGLPAWVPEKGACPLRFTGFEAEGETKWKTMFFNCQSRPGDGGLSHLSPRAASSPPDPPLLRPRGQNSEPAVLHLIPLTHVLTEASDQHVVMKCLIGAWLHRAQGLAGG